MNVDCPARLKESILHFASRKVMNIEGLGDALVTQLLERQLLTSVAGIYSLDEEQLLQLERIGKKSAQSLLAEIENSKKAPLNRVLFALGIRFVGERTAQLLAEAFGSMDALMAASVEELERVDEVGPRVAQAIHEFFAEEKNRKLVEKLRQAGLTFTAEKKRKSSQLEGLTFVLTGTMADLTREEAKARIEAAGGRVSGFRQQENQLLGRWRGRGIEARQSTGTQGSSHRAGTAAGNAGMIHRCNLTERRQHPSAGMRAMMRRIFAFRLPGVLLLSVAFGAALPTAAQPRRDQNNFYQGASRGVRGRQLRVRPRPALSQR